MAGGFGAPSFSGYYGGSLGRSTNGQSPQTGGPNYNVSPMAGGTAETPASQQASADVTQWGLFGEPLTWWLTIFALLILLSLLGAKR